MLFSWPVRRCIHAFMHTYIHAHTQKKKNKKEEEENASKWKAKAVRKMAAPFRLREKLEVGRRGFGLPI